MPIAVQYEYKKPTTLPDTLALLAREGAMVLAGGTDLIVDLKEGRAAPKLLIDVKGLTELNGLTLRDGGLFIGANATFAEIVHSPLVQQHWLVLAESSETVASVPVRNRATLAGNICSAVPCLDSAPALLLFDATVIVEGTAGERKVSIHDWFVGPRKTALQPGELVKGVHLPQIPQKYAAIYVKLGRYAGEDLAQAGIAAMVLADGAVRLAFCALGPIPRRSTVIEKTLSGKTLDDSTLAAAVALLPQEISPISDVRASQTYRLHMAGIMLTRGLQAAAERLQGKSINAATLLGG